MSFEPFRGLGEQRCLLFLDSSLLFLDSSLLFLDSSLLFPE